MVVVFSVILLVCQVFILVCPLFYKSVPRLDFLPLIALAVLWMNQWLFHGKSSVLSTILWVVFAPISLVAILSAVFTLFSYGDAEKNEGPVTFGDITAPNGITMVYHPGGSNLPRNINAYIAGKLAQNGYKVILYTAHTGLDINLKNVSALGLSSPSYGSEIRPPIANFIKRTDLSGVKCFVVITGGGKSPQSAEVEKVKKLIESKGGIFIGGQKFIASDLKKTGQIDDFIANIDNKL